MFFDVSIKIALIINIVALLLNVVLCFFNNGTNIANQLKEITSYCRWIGLLYFAFAWFMGNGSIVSAGRTTYQQVAYYMLIISVGWILVFGLSVISKFWKSGDKMSSHLLGMGILYFILAYFLH